jgi:copper transport protein
VTRRILTGVVLAVLALMVGASAVGAHAALESTSPAAGSALETAPDEIVLTFNEPVELDLGGVRVYDSEREQVVDGTDASVSGGGRVVTVPVDDLGEDAYVVTWRATSADSHPISGAFSFRVGEGGVTEETEALVEELLAAEGESQAAGALYAAVRALVFVGLAGLVGLWGFTWLVESRVFGERAFRRLVWAFWGVLVGATALSIGLQGVTAGGLPLSDALDPSVWSAVVETRFGRMALVRLGLLVLALPLLVLGRRPATERDGELPSWWLLGTGAVSLGLLVTVAWAGHAGSGRYIGLAMTLDIVHQAAMAIWLGGLVALLVLVLPADDPERLRTTVPRFSSTAFTCVVLLVVTGTVQAWRQLGSLDALTDTNYGRVLLVKVAIVVGLVALAAFSRAVVRRGVRAGQPLPAGPGALVSSDDTADVEHLERSVAFEVVLGVAVLVVTAFLVNIPPGIDSLDEPWAGQLQAGELTVDVTVDPAAAGPVTMHVYALSADGTPVDVEDLTVELTLPSEDIGPFEVPLEPAGPGHYSAYDYEVPFDGDWLLDVQVRVTEFEQVGAEATVPVG